MFCKKSLVLLTGISIAALYGWGTCVLAEEEEAGPKGLFFEQLDKPSQSLNTGLRYWIELKHGTKITHVTNKHLFRSGDQIRFHVRPNIDGYAYILLKSGSRGERCVLFPDTKRSEDNHVEHGTDYTLPLDGYLTFDQNPGTETVSLLLARKQIDGEAYLKQPPEQPTVIASSQAGSKDLVPAKVLVVYSDPATRSNSESSGKQSAEHTTKQLVAPPATSSNPTTRTVPSKQSTVTSKLRKVFAPKHRVPVKPTEIAAASDGQTRALIPDQGDSAGATKGCIVTVVRTEPSGILHVDVALKHD